MVPMSTVYFDASWYLCRRDQQTARCSQKGHVPWKWQEQLAIIRAYKEEQYDKLAEILRESLDMEKPYMRSWD